MEIFLPRIFMIDLFSKVFQSGTKVEITKYYQFKLKIEEREQKEADLFMINNISNIMICPTIVGIVF